MTTALMNRRAFLRRLPVVGCAVMLAACQQGAPSSSSGTSSKVAAGNGPASANEWDALVAAAKAEGVVNVYGGGSGEDTQRPLVQGFEKAFPGIKVQGTFAPGAAMISRLLAERQANKYLADVLVHGGGPAFATLKDAGVLAPIESLVILPEVLDQTKWLDGHLWWTDEVRPYTNLSFQGSVQALLTYNTKLVDPGQFHSYRDILDPKWKGKMTATDVRRSGPGALQVVFLYTHPDLGADFLDHLFGDMALILSNDQRQMVDWVAQGRYPLGVFMAGSSIAQAMEQGLPLGIVPPEQFKEGGPLGTGQGSVSYPDKAPHPNAAKVYVNWLLSRDGQLAWQDGTRLNSLRVDVPKDGLYATDVPKPGVKYTNMGAEKYSRLGQQSINDVITKALERAQP